MNKHLIFYSQEISREISSYTYFNLNRANLVKLLGYQDFQMRFHRIFGHIVLCGRITLQGDFCMLAKFGWWHCCIVTALLIFFFESVFKAFQEIGKQKILTSSKYGHHWLGWLRLALLFFCLRGSKQQQRPFLRPVASRLSYVVS